MNNNALNLIELSQNKSDVGNLIEINDLISNFNIKRIYYITHVKRFTIRGHHAHKELLQIIWCPYGSIEILLDDGVDKVIYILDSPEKAIKIGPGIWREMKWLQSDSVLCVAASDYYNEDDYVRDYQKFLQMVNEGYWNEK